MELHRWTNPHQPQTLQIGVFLLYIRAVFALLPISATTYDYWGPLASVIAAVAMVLGGLGIANEKRWGYRVAVGISALGVLPLVLLLLQEGPELLVDFNFVIFAIFPIAQLIVLLHPMSREHQRIWFT